MSCIFQVQERLPVGELHYGERLAHTWVRSDAQEEYANLNIVQYAKSLNLVDLLTHYLRSPYGAAQCSLSNDELERRTCWRIQKALAVHSRGYPVRRLLIRHAES